MIHPKVNVSKGSARNNLNGQVIRKKSRNTAFQQSIRNDQPTFRQSKNAKVHINTTDFYDHLANSVLVNKQLLPTKPRYGRMVSNCIQRESRDSRQQKRQNLDYNNQALMAELQVRNKQLEVMASECHLLKQSLKVQQQRRKKIQHDRKQISTQLGQKTKQLQKLQIDNKKLIKQKEYLVKQIEFLEKINYDDKTRNAQSYREKYLAKQIQDMRRQISMNKNQIQKHLQNEVKRISDEKYGIETLYKALKVQKQTMIKQFQMFRIQEKGSVFNSEQYVKLREKYKDCLDAYKKLKIEYVEVQKQLNRSLSNIPQHILNSNSSLSIVLSSSSSQKSNISLDKQNKYQEKGKKSKNLLFIQVPSQKNSAKKSLSPRNRQQKPMMDFKKPLSPKDSKKSYQVHSFTAQPKNSVQQNQSTRRPQKPSNFFNEAYRLKIGLGKTSAQK